MAAIIEITESKLNHSVPDLEVNLPGYDISDVVEIQMVLLLLVI